MIRVLGQHHTYTVRDSTRLECGLAIAMEVHGQDHVLLPVPDCLADLQVRDGRGRELVVIPDGAFEEMSGIDRGALKKIMLDGMTAEMKGKNGGDDSPAGYRIIHVMLGDRGGRDGGTRYETVNLRWIRPMSFDKSRWLTLKSTFDADVVRYGFTQSAGSSTCVTIRLGGGLRFAPEPTWETIAGSPPPARAVMRSEAVHAVQFGGTEDPSRLSASVVCTVHLAMKCWSALGATIGLAVPALLLLAAALAVEVGMSFEILAGTVALLMAFRWFVFEDLPIMKRWQWMIFFAVALNASTLLALHVPWETLLRVAAPW